MLQELMFHKMEHIIRRTTYFKMKKGDVPIFKNPVNAQWLLHV